MEWSKHILIKIVLLVSKKSPWRWPHEWPKLVGDHNTIKVRKLKLKFICWCLVLYILQGKTVVSSHRRTDRRKDGWIDGWVVGWTWALHKAFVLNFRRMQKHYFIVYVLRWMTMYRVSTWIIIYMAESTECSSISDMFSTFHNCSKKFYMNTFSENVHSSCRAV